MWFVLNYLVSFVRWFDFSCLFWCVTLHCVYTGLWLNVGFGFACIWLGSCLLWLCWLRLLGLVICGYFVVFWVDVFT